MQENHPSALFSRGISDEKSGNGWLHAETGSTNLNQFTEMKELRSLLMATDFSADSRYAMNRAGLICSSAGISRGVALHVAETSWLETLKRSVNRSDDIEQQVLHNVMDTLDDAVESTWRHTGIRLESRLVSGKAVDTILEASTDADIIVLGARSHHTFQDMTVGSTPSRVIRRSVKPVLVVRNEAEHAYRKVLVAVDFSGHSLESLQWAAAIEPEAPIYLLHVYHAMFEHKMKYAGIKEDAIEEYRSQARAEAEVEMDRFLSSVSGIREDRLHQMIRHGSHIASILVREIRKTGAELIVVGKHGKTLMEHLLLGSVTLNLLDHAPCDLLVTQ
jgi:nucleotide-binding universal stress UspA family protein